MATFMPDAYTARARLAPALTVLFPIVVDVLAAVPTVQTWWEKALAGLLGVGLWMAPAQWVADRGRARQARLWQDWGGVPTTAALRWRSATNKIAMGERHAHVSRATGIALPDDAAESRDPIGADESYEAATGILREATRDAAKFPLVTAAVTDYGFRRNSYGLRRIGLTVAALAAAVAAALLVIGIRSSHVSWKWAIAALIVDLICLAWWWRGVTVDAVRSAGDRYAERLLAGASQVPDAPTNSCKQFKRGNKNR